MVFIFSDVTDQGFLEDACNKLDPSIIFSIIVLSCEKFNCSLLPLFFLSAVENNVVELDLY